MSEKQEQSANNIQKDENLFDQSDAFVSQTSSERLDKNMDNFQQSVDIVMPHNIQEEGKIYSIETYEYSTCKLIFSYIIYLLTGGIAYLFSRWYPEFRLWLQLTKCQPEKAQVVKIVTQDSVVNLIEITDDGWDEYYENGCRGRISFEFRLHKYFYCEARNRFEPNLINFEEFTNYDIFTTYGKGFESEEHYQKKLKRIGPNNTFIPEKGIMKILLDEVLSPFYLFMLFSCVLWYFFEEYEAYAVLIFSMSIAIVVFTLIDIKTNYDRLRQMTYYETTLRVYRNVSNIINVDNENQTYKILDEQQLAAKGLVISSQELVPGDLVEVPENCLMPCDLVLLNGSCIMNESMITGESVTVIKSSLPFTHQMYTPTENCKNHTLFAGTQCIQRLGENGGQNQVLAVVTQTSLNTLKGSIVRSILFPKQNYFKFYKDSLKFVLVYIIFAIIGLTISFFFMISGYEQGYVDAEKFAIRMLDLITIIVPPALPGCLAIGIYIAIYRMKKKQIFCISPPRVNVCGKISTICFDKTGTLTEDGLELFGIQTVQYNQDNKISFNGLVPNLITALQKDQPSHYQSNFLLYSKTQPTIVLRDVMVSCHSIVVEPTGKLLGDPIEVEMFKNTGWKLQFENIQQVFPEKIQALVFQGILQENQLEQQSTENLKQRTPKIGIIKRYEFSPELQIMSVIVKREHNKSAPEKTFWLHTKGSPEKMQNLFMRQTIPDEYQEVLSRQAQKGYRVLAIGIKQIEIDEEELSKLQRDEVENNLIFVGFLYFENKLKPESSSNIDLLHQAHVRTVMVTGDNLLTALWVARQCRIINQNQAIYHSVLKEDGKIEFQHYQYLEDNYQLKEEDDQIQNYDQQPQAKMDENLEDSVNNVYQQIHMDKNAVIALTGPAFMQIVKRQAAGDDEFNERFVRSLMNRTLVFARMKPDEKALLVKMLQKPTKKVRYFVCMCGDGANDCIALKNSDAGVSLSEAEASIAAPFTSKTKNISCVVKILREGKAALAVSFALYEFMFIYAMIQATTTVLTYFVYGLPSNNQFLFWDIPLVFLSAAAFGLSKAHKPLSKEYPKSSLFSFNMLTGIFGHILIFIIMQVLLFISLINQKWYIPAYQIVEINKNNEEYEDGSSYESTSLFWLANFQYLIISLLMQKGYSFRRPFYTNFWYTFIFSMGLILSLLILLSDIQFLNNTLNIVTQVEQNNNIISEMPYQWRFNVLSIAIINAIISLLYQFYLVELFTMIWKKLNKKN